MRSYLVAIISQCLIGIFVYYVYKLTTDYILSQEYSPADFIHLKGTIWYVVCGDLVGRKAPSQQCKTNCSSFFCYLCISITYFYVIYFHPEMILLLLSAYIFISLNDTWRPKCAREHYWSFLTTLF